MAGVRANLPGYSGPRDLSSKLRGRLGDSYAGAGDANPSVSDSYSGVGDANPNSRGANVERG